MQNTPDIQYGPANTNQNVGPHLVKFDFLPYISCQAKPNNEEETILRIF